MLIQLILIFLMGASLASFACLIGYRLTLGQSIILPSSQCDRCASPLAWMDVIPVASYLFLNGQSRCCQQKLSKAYLIVELIGGLAGCLLVLYASYDRPTAVLAGLLVFFGIAMTISDLKAFLLPNPLMFTFLICSLAYVLLFLPQLFFWRLLAMVAVFCLMAALVFCQPKALGGGDVKLMAILALLLGLETFFLSLLIASSLGLLTFTWSLFRHHRLRYLPFGPFLFTGSLISLFVDRLLF